RQRSRDGERAGDKCPSHLAALGPREVAVALLDEDRLAEDEVANADLARGDLRQRAVAAVVRQPGGASDGCRREAADGAERALAGAPEMTDRAVGPLRLCQRGDLRVLRRGGAA